MGSWEKCVRGRSGPEGRGCLPLPFFPLPLPLPLSLHSFSCPALVFDFFPSLAMSLRLLSSDMDPVTVESLITTTDLGSLATPAGRAAEEAEGDGPSGCSTSSATLTPDRTPRLISISRFTARSHIWRATSRPRVFRRRMKSHAGQGGESNLPLEPTACLSSFEEEQEFQASPDVVIRSTTRSGDSSLMVTISSPSSTPSTWGFAPEAPKAAEEKQAFGTSATKRRLLACSLNESPSQPAGSRTFRTGCSPFSMESGWRWPPVPPSRPQPLT
mmetsp:Transcript_51656/g.162320  ORF Transcript_51656/g.162320 Transcript_51656/m.162320 type:complete len:272 (-) Transcript_51656:2-817(-)